MLDRKEPENSLQVSNSAHTVLVIIIMHSEAQTSKHMFEWRVTLSYNSLLNLFCSSSSVSSADLLPGSGVPGGGPVLPRGRLLSGRGPPTSPPLLGHRPAGPVQQPLQGGRVRVQLLFPAPPAQHGREEAWLFGVAPRPEGAAQDLKQPGGALWVQLMMMSFKAKLDEEE